MALEMKYLRGSVVWARLAGYERSSVQSGSRPVLVVSSLAGSITSDVIQVCPLTTKIKDLSVNVDVGTLPGQDRQSQVLTNQITTIPRTYIGDYITSFDEITMQKVETGILTALGIAKPVVSKIQATQEALASAKKDREALENLLPQAKEILKVLGELVKKVDGANIKVVGNKPGTKRVRRSPETIELFIQEWEDKYNDKKEVAEAFGFPSYASAYNFYQYHKKKDEE